MRKKSQIIFIIIVCVILSTIGFITYFAILETEKSTGVENEWSEWITSGPFSLQRYQHKLGENIYFIARGIAPHERGTIKFYMPNNNVYTSIPFDGAIKSDWNQYFKPDTQPRKGWCSPEDLVGVWTMVFEGVPYKPIQFEFIYEYISGGEADITNLCRDTT